MLSVISPTYSSIISLCPFLSAFLLFSFVRCEVFFPFPFEKSMGTGLSRSSSNASNNSKLRRSQTVRYNPRSRRTTSSGGRLTPPSTPRATLEPPPYVPAIDDQWSLNMLPPEERHVYHLHPHSPEIVLHVQRSVGYAIPASAYIDHHKASKKTSFGVSSLLTAARGNRYATHPVQVSCLRCTEQFASPRSKLPRRASLKSSTSPSLHLQVSHGYVKPSHAWFLYRKGGDIPHLQKANGYSSVPAHWIWHNRPRRERAVRSNGVDDHARSTISTVNSGPGQLVQPVNENPLDIKEPAQHTNMMLPNIDSQMDVSSGDRPASTRKASLARRRSMDSLHSSFKTPDVEPTKSGTSTSPRLPQEIRLRRPSAQPRKNLPPLGSVLKADRNSQSSNSHGRRSSLANADIPMKSEIAYEAVTHTAVHIFEPALANERTEVSGAAEDSQKAHSATLQVVRTRNSVYEVIWEDKLSAKTIAAGESSKQSPHEAEALSSVAAWSKESPSKSKEHQTSQKIVQVNTKLAAWS